MVCPVSVVCCQVEVSASGLSLVQRSPAKCGVSSECCVLSGRGLCDGLITRPEESYWLWCDLENLVNEEALAHWGLLRQRERNKNTHQVQKSTLLTLR